MLCRAGVVISRFFMDGSLPKCGTVGFASRKCFSGVIGLSSLNNSIAAAIKIRLTPPPPPTSSPPLLLRVARDA